MEEQKPFRTINGVINVTVEKLYLINYEDLSMAAQFQDQKLPLKHNAGLELIMENGNYGVRINQLSNSDNFSHDDNNNVHFEIVFKKLQDGEVRSNKFDRILWQQ